MSRELDDLRRFGSAQISRIVASDIIINARVKEMKVASAARAAHLIKEAKAKVSVIDVRTHTDSFFD